MTFTYISDFTFLILFRFDRIDLLSWMFTVCFLFCFFGSFTNSFLSKSLEQHRNLRIYTSCSVQIPDLKRHEGVYAK